MAVIVVKGVLSLVAYEVCIGLSHTEEIIPLSHTHTSTHPNLVITKVKQLINNDFVGLIPRAVNCFSVIGKGSNKDICRI